MDNQQTPETKSHVCALSLDMTGDCMICAIEHDLDHANEELSKKYVEYDKLFDEAYQIRIERDHANGELANALKERDEARTERDILKLDAQREAEHHDRMVAEIEKVYKERDEARAAIPAGEWVAYEDHKKVHDAASRLLVAINKELPIGCFTLVSNEYYRLQNAIYGKESVK
jgi:hypothetical protein